MKLMSIDKNLTYKVWFNKSEKEALTRGIDFLIKDIEIELFTRTGFNLEQYRVLSKYLLDQSSTCINLTKEQLIMLQQLLNEICYGIFIDDFEKKIGLQLIQLRKMHEQISNFIDKSSVHI